MCRWQRWVLITIISFGYRSEGKCFFPRCRAIDYMESRCLLSPPGNRLIGFIYLLVLYITCVKFFIFFYRLMIFLRELFFILVVVSGCIPNSQSKFGHQEAHIGRQIWQRWTNMPLSFRFTFFFFLVRCQDCCSFIQVDLSAAFSFANVLPTYNEIVIITLSKMKVTMQYF